MARAAKAIIPHDKRTASFDYIIAELVKQKIELEKQKVQLETYKAENMKLRDSLVSLTEEIERLDNAKGKRSIKAEPNYFVIIDFRFNHFSYIELNVLNVIESGVLGNVNALFYLPV